MSGPFIALMKSPQHEGGQATAAYLRVGSILLIKEAYWRAGSEVVFCNEATNDPWSLFVEEEPESIVKELAVLEASQPNA